MFLGASDIYFIGGFGTVAWVDVKEYEMLQPDKIAVDGGEQNLKVNLWNSLKSTQKGRSWGDRGGGEEDDECSLVS